MSATVASWCQQRHRHLAFLKMLLLSLSLSLCNHVSIQFKKMVKFKGQTVYIKGKLIIPDSVITNFVFHNKCKIVWYST